MSLFLLRTDKAITLELWFLKARIFKRWGSRKKKSYDLIPPYNNFIVIEGPYLETIQEEIKKQEEVKDMFSGCSYAVIRVKIIKEKENE